MNGNGWLKVGAVAVAAALLTTGMYLAIQAPGGSGQHNVIVGPRPGSAGQDVRSIDLLSGTPMKQTDGGIASFAGLGELNRMLEQFTASTPPYYYYDTTYRDTPALADGGGAGYSGAVNEASADAGSQSYTGTNIQVSGVDEGDTVKSDGGHAYIVSGGGDSVFIANISDPGDLRIDSEIRVNGSVREIYLDGDMLVLVEQSFHFEGGYYRSGCLYSDDPEIFVEVWDVTDREFPVPERTVSLPGYFSASRMIDHVLYLMGSQYLRGTYDNESLLPLPLDSLYRLEGQDSNNLMTFMTLDLADADADPAVMGIFMDPAGCIYVSERNIYLTHMKAEEPAMPYSPYAYAPPEETTVIHRLGIRGQDLKYQAMGEVPGRVLNRFSMDEFDGHFRIATTSGRSWGAGSEEARNMVHVLDMGLNITGSLDDIAPGEQIYSARFMGQRCYLVTYRQVDPFFAIDLHDASNPRILGQLKIPGYSTYLHPYDEDHIIGLGVDGGSWEGNLKVSLFDVSDVEHPAELDTYSLPGRYSYSSAMYDPHAFNFDVGRNLLVVPAYVDGGDLDYYYSEGSLTTGSVGGDAGITGNVALVLSISPESGITELGRVRHVMQMEPQPLTGPDHPYPDYPGPIYPGPEIYTCRIERSFISGDVLYTVSAAMLQANALPSLNKLDSLELEAGTPAF